MEHLLSCLKKGLWMWRWKKIKQQTFQFCKKFGKDPFTRRCKVTNSFIAVWSVVLSKLIMKQNCDSIAWDLIVVGFFCIISHHFYIISHIFWHNDRNLQGRDIRSILSNMCFYVTVLLCVCSTSSGLHFLKFGIDLLALWFYLIYCYSESSVYIDQKDSLKRESVASLAKQEIQNTCSERRRM